MNTDADGGGQEVLDWFLGTVRGYEAGDESYFDNFTNDASFFLLTSPTRIDGLETWREMFGPAFTRSQRVSQVLSPEVRQLGPDAALITFHNRVLADDVSINARATVVAVRDGGSYRIVHMHISPLGAGTGKVGVDAGDLERLTVLEERVAAAAAMVGTPK